MDNRTRFKALIIGLWWSQATLQGAQAAPCLQYSSMQGPVYSANQIEFSETDETARLTAVEYCVTSDGANFRGFTASFTNSVGAVTTQTYGLIGEAGDTCQTETFAEEVVSLQVLHDDEDIEGLILRDSLGVDHSMVADGVDAYTSIELAGRLIGFRMNMGSGGGGLTYQPLQVSAIYNSCNCPASTFLGDAAPRDLTATAAMTDDVATLAYQKNVIEDVFDQNCGKYTVSVDPPELLTVEKVGSVGPSGLAYFDQITLSKGTLDDVGQRTITVTVSQETSNGDGYSSPSAGQMDSIQYEILATINPCSVDSFTADSVPVDMSYTLGAAAMLSQNPHTYTQTPDCGYDVTVTIEGLDPALGTHDDATNDFTINQVSDAALLGLKEVTVTATIQVPDDYSLATYTPLEVVQTFTIDVRADCSVNTLTLVSAPTDMSTTVGEADPLTEAQVLALVTDSVSDGLGEPAGNTYCGERVYTLTIDGSSIDNHAFVTYDADTRTVTPDSSSSDDIGTYTVLLEVSLVDFPGVTAASATFTLEVQSSPCYVTLLSLDPPLADMTLAVLDPAETQAVPSVKDSEGVAADAVNFEALCGARTIEIKSVTPENPAYGGFFTFDVQTGTMTLQSDNVDHIGQYEVTLVFALVDYAEITATDTFLITVEPCALTSLEAVDPPTLYEYPFSDNPVTLLHNFEQQPACGYTITVSIPDLDADVVSLNVAGDQHFTAWQTTDPAKAGTTSYTLTATIDVPDDWQQASTTPVTTNYSFDVEIQDPCATTTLILDATLNDMSYRVEDTTATQTLPVVKDEASCALTPNDCLTFCGARTESISVATKSDGVDVADFSGFMTYDAETRIISVETAELSLLNVYTVTLTATIDNYSDVTQSFTFDIEISANECLLTDLETPTNLADMVFYLSDPVGATVQSYPEVRDTVSCQADEADCMTNCGARAIAIVSVLPSSPSRDLYLTVDDGASQFSVLTTDSSHIHQYTVTLSYTLVDFTQITTTETFKITIHPCQIFTFTETAPLSDVTYVLQGDAMDNFAAYSFTQTNDCGYEQTITVDIPTEIQSVLTHNAETQDFSLAQTTDLATLGAHTITVTATIDVPQEYPNQDTLVAQTAVSSFILTINPCVITSFAIDTQPSTVTYKTGDPALTDGAFTFLQTPACDYEVTVTLTSTTPPELASTGLVVLNDETNDFTIETGEQTYVGTGHTLSVTATISEYLNNDLASPSTQDHQVTFDVTLDIINGCIETVLSWEEDLVDLQIMINEGPGTYTHPQAIDSKSSTLGLADGLTYCGNRLYEFAVTPSSPDYAEFLTYDAETRTFTAESTNKVHYGTYVVTMTATLELFPDDVDPLVGTFNLIVNASPCLLSYFLIPEGSSLEPIVTHVDPDATPVVTDFPIVQDYASCADSGDCLALCGGRTITLGEDFVASDAYTEISRFFTFDDQASTMTIVADSLDYIGQYEVTLVYTLTDYPQVTDTEVLTITITPCVITAYTANLQPTSLEYTLGDDAFTTLHSQTQEPLCGYTETGVITGLDDGFLSIGEILAQFQSVYESQDKTFKGTYTATFRATIQVPDDYTQSTFTEWEVTYDYEVVIVNPCWETELIWAIDDEASSPFALSEQTIMVFEGALEYQLPDMHDSVSLRLYADPEGVDDATLQQLQAADVPDGLSYCGSRTFVITIDMGDVVDFVADDFVSFDAAGKKMTAESDNLDHLGTYPVTLTVTLDDYDTIVFEETYDLVVDCNPCWITQFTGSSLTTVTIEAVMGTQSTMLWPTGNVAAESCTDPDPVTGLCPDCLKRIVTIGDWTADDVANTSQLTDFWTYTDEVDQNFATPSTIDYIGAYTVPVNFVLESFDIITYDTEFQVIVSPCVLTELTDNSLDPVTQTPIYFEYTLGDDSVTQAPTATYFVQEPLCGYPETYTVDIPTDLDGIFTFDTDTGEYGFIKTWDRALLEGSFELPITATVAQPTDYTKAETENVENSISVRIVIVDPCETTVLMQQTPLVDMDIEIFEGSVITSIASHVGDAVGCRADPDNCVDYCGERQFTFLVDDVEVDLLSDEFNFIAFTYDEETGETEVKLESDTIAHFGIYTITVRESLVDFPLIETVEMSFMVNVDVEECFLTQFVIPSSIYDEETGESEALVTPIYTQGTMTLPVVQDTRAQEQGNQDGVSHCGGRVYKILGVINADTQAELTEEEWSTWLSLTDTDIVAKTDDITMIGFYTLTMEYSLADYIDESLLATEDIVIELQDPCWFSTLTAPAFTEQYTFDLYQDQVIEVLGMVNTELGTECGGFTYEVTYDKGPKLQAYKRGEFDVWTVDETDDGAGGQIKLEMPSTSDREWLGLHTYIVKSTNGHADHAPRGEEGLYESLEIEFTVEIVDPCLDTIVNADGGMGAVPEISVESGWRRIELDWSMAGPTDEASVAYTESGYALCGGYSYTVVNQDRLDFEYNNVLELEVKDNHLKDKADSFSLAIYNDPDGYFYEFSLFIRIGIADYEDTATPYYLPFSVSTRICKPDTVTMSQIEDQTSHVAQDFASSVTIETVQASCIYGSYSVAYELLWVHANSTVSETLPAFVSYSDNGDSTLTVDWETDSFGDIGEYVLRAQASLSFNYVELERYSTDFKIIVLPRKVDTNQQDSFKVLWELELADQEVYVGQEHFYEVYVAPNPYEQERTISFDPKTARNFVSWDSDFQFFIFRGHTDLDVGQHEICMSVTYTVFSSREVRQDCFKVIVNLEREEVPEDPQVAVEDGLTDQNQESQDPNDPSNVGQATESESSDPEAKKETKILQLVTIEDQLEAQDALFADLKAQGITVPDVKQGEVSPEGTASLRFPIPMVFPDDLLDQINEQQVAQKRRRLQSGSLTDLLETSQELPYLEVSMINPASSDRDGDEYLDKNLQSFRALSVSSSEIKLGLSFGDPLVVSQEVDPDMLLVTINMHRFVNIKGDRIPNGFLQKLELFRLVASPDEAQLYEAIAKGLLWIATLIAGTFFGVMVLTGSSDKLGHLWTFINGLQLISLLPLYETLKTPANVSIFTRQLIRFASLNIFGVESDKYTEEAPLNVNFAACGLDHASYSANVGTATRLILIGTFVSTFVFIGSKLSSKIRFGWVTNGWMRLVTQLYLWLTFVSVVGLRADTLLQEQDKAMADKSRKLSIVTLTALCLCTVLLPVLYVLNRQKWDDPAFKDKAGSAMVAVETARKPQWYLMVFVESFYLRRLFFVICLVSITSTKFWVSQLLQLATCLWFVAMLQRWSPLKSTLNRRLEMLNECTLYVLVSSLYGLTDVLPDPQLRKSYGNLYIAAVCVNISVHSVAMLAMTWHRIRLVMARFKNEAFRKLWMRTQEIKAARYEQRMIEAKAKSMILSVAKQEKVQNELDELENIPDLEIDEEIGIEQAEHIQNELDAIDELPDADPDYGEEDADFDVDYELSHLYASSGGIRDAQGGSSSSKLLDRTGLIDVTYKSSQPRSTTAKVGIGAKDGGEDLSYVDALNDDFDGLIHPMGDAAEAIGQPPVDESFDDYILASDRNLKSQEALEGSPEGEGPEVGVDEGEVPIERDPEAEGPQEQEQSSVKEQQEVAQDLVEDLGGDGEGDEELEREEEHSVLVISDDE